MPDVGKIWVGRWKAQFGETLDGPIQTDPIGLSYILRATGPITTDGGETITADDVVSKVENEAYIRFGDGDQSRRKAYLLDIAAKSSRNLINANDPQKLLTALHGAASDHRHRVYIRRESQQQSMPRTP